MKRLYTLLTGLIVLTFFSNLSAQDYVRKELTIPRLDSTTYINIDGNMTDPAWNNAAQINIVTNTGYEMFANKYGRPSLTEPDYDQLFARVLYKTDTLFVFVHIDEVVNDSTNLFWIPTQSGHWGGDQLFISLSNRIGKDLKGNYDGNVYTAPDGPYHFLVFGSKPTLNGDVATYIPTEYRTCLEDSEKVFLASDISRYAVKFDTTTGVWNVEMAIYNPNVAANGKIGFNLGGSMSSTTSYQNSGDAYGYWTWQPNIPNNPFGDPFGNGDPGYYNLKNSDYWAVLNFAPGAGDYVRPNFTVPVVDPNLIHIDGFANEPAWSNARVIDIIGNSGFNIFANKYGRPSLTEPDYDALNAKLLWAKDTLYAFIHIDEVVNDSTDLFWIPTQSGHWGGDQLFVSLSDRIGTNLKGWYDGNVYSAPDGPYHFLVFGDKATLNGDTPTNVPFEYRKCFNQSDSINTFLASNISRYALHVDTTTGVWDVEMAIYCPQIASQSEIGFNLGGSMSSRTSYQNSGDAYGYWTWQPNIPNQPFGDPYGNGDPGFYNLKDATYFATLSFINSITGIKDPYTGVIAPKVFSLYQNYPNPFNPSTTIKFDVATLKPVTLKIYNALGQMVQNLIDGKSYNPGTYSINWNASRFSSGVYFLELRAGDVVQSRKMMLLK
jgi:hypothetical protein